MVMILLRIQEEYHGPTLPEMTDLLEGNSGPIEVRWENTRREIALLERFRDREITLVVKDLAAMERAASSVGANFTFERDILVTALTALNSNEHSGWRSFVARMGSGVSRGLLIGIASSGIRRGLKVASLRSVLDGCLFEDVSPIDADVLLGLHTGL